MTRSALPAVLLLAVFALPAQAGRARRGGKSDARGRPTVKGDLKSNLYTLNFFGKQPDVVLALYTAAYRVLAANKEASFADLATNPEVQRICRENGIRHLGGPMLGGVTANGVRVWLRTVKPARAEVRVTVDGTETTFGPVKTTAASDLAAVVKVTGLKPATYYRYRVLVDGEAIAIPKDAAITTAPADSKTGKVRIAFGSCFHRWGLGNKAQADLIRTRKAAAALFLGDIAVQDRNNHLGLHRADYLMRDLIPAWRSLVASVPVYATWDDHDYFDNDRAGIPRRYTQKDRAGVRAVFTRAWNNPSYGFGDERGGVFLRTRIGPCDVVMVDNRYFRKKGKGSFLGDQQMLWLKKQLLSCRGPFIILSCGTMWSDFVSNGKDSWGRWDRKGREEIFALIEKNRIRGVLLISGDRHGARVFRVPRPSGFQFYEFGAASLGGYFGPPAKRPAWNTQLYGMSRRYAFGEFTIDATIPDPEVTFRLIQDSGQELFKLKLKRSQLTPKGN